MLRALLRAIIEIPLSIFLFVVMTLAYLWELLSDICRAVAVNASLWWKDFIWLVKFPFKKPE